MDETLTEDDEGKRVVGPGGEEIGTVTKVDQGVAHVDPAGGLSDVVKRRLDWGQQGDYTLQETQIEAVRDDELVVQDV